MSITPEPARKSTLKPHDANVLRWTAKRKAEVVYEIIRGKSFQEVATKRNLKVADVKQSGGRINGASRRRG